MMILSEKLLKFHFFFKGFVAYIVAHATDLLISFKNKHHGTNLDLFN